jgi:O-antigen/teichoic acid export membrane protein
VLVLLGPQWVQAGTIFAWLGISGLIEPFSYTTIWLFLTQNRTRQQFYWGIISSTLMVSAIVVGLPWGPLGVATAYSLVSLFIRMPLLFWYVGREGHVRTHHLYAALVPFACTTGAVLLSIFGLRQVVGAIDPLLGLITAAVITAVVSLLTLIALPTGRTVLSDLKSLPALLFKRKVTT